jgi:DNA polymerase
MTKQSDLDQVRADILAQNVCPELAEQAANLVMGDGNVDADVVFIGEAPGKNEDEQGLPFVGAAGKFLNEMLATAGMKRGDVYITNIVKYRPPNNRDPFPEEKEAFWPFLLRQLEIIQPKIIATLGRHSMEYFLSGARISEIHGKPKRINLEDGQTVVIMPLFHPAAALYNGAMRETLIDDFMQVPSIIKRVNERDNVLKIMTE